MKKTVLSLLAVAAVAVSVNAEPRFGMVAYNGGNNGAFNSALGTSNSGLGNFQPGIIVVDDQYTASLSFGSITIDNSGTKETNSSFTLGANYKMALDANNAGTFGIAYTSVSGDHFDSANNLQVLAGIERNLGNNLLLTLEAVVYETGKVDANAAGFASGRFGSATETKTSGFLNGGRFGLAYLL
jgi:hypothetical protein